jgi:hypothetical protein
VLLHKLVLVVDIADAEDAGLALEFADEREVFVPGVESWGDDRGRR